MEYPALLKAGMHDMTLLDMKNICVDAFNDSERREILFSRLKSYIGQFEEFSLDMEIWIDGSFVTKKINPSDIDLVVIFDEKSVNALSSEEQNTLKQLFEKETIKIRYECDVYFIPNRIDDKSYWRGMFGFDKNENPKGIIRLNIKGNL